MLLHVDVLYVHVIVMIKAWSGCGLGGAETIKVVTTIREFVLQSLCTFSALCIDVEQQG